MGKPSVDIIIVSYKSGAYLIRCIKSIINAAFNTPINLYIIDNNSGEDTDAIKHICPQIEIIKNIENIGFAAAVNQGIGRSSSKYLLIINPDTMLSANFFEPLLTYMEKNKRVSVVGPKIFDPDRSIQGSARAFPNALTALYGRSSPLTRYFPNNPISKSNIRNIGSDGISPIKVDWVSGACMFVRKEAIKEVGLMDERFFMYWEDADWCERMWRKGWEVIYLPTASLYHYVGKSSDSRPLRSIYHFHKSSFLLHAKYASWFKTIFNPLVVLLLFTRGLVAVCLKLLNKPKRKREKTTKTTTEKSKILHIITRLIVGGAQENTLLTSQILSKNNWEVDIISGPQTGPEGSLERYARINLLPLIYEPNLVRKIHPLKDMISFWRLFRLIRTGKYPVVHTHSSKAGIIGRWAAWLARVQVIIHTVHGWGFTEYQKPIVQWLYKFLERVTLRITDKLIVVTKLDINKGLEAGIGSSDDYELIRSGIELQRFASPKKSRKAVHKELGIPLEAIVIGTVTRLSPQKAPLVFVKAAQLIATEYQNAHFVIVGDGPLRGEIEALIHEFGLGEQIHLTGLRSDVPDLLSAFDIFTLSSLWEGLPRVLPQAMAAGLPIVASAIDGSKEIIQDHVNGRLFPPGDYDAMARAILSLIENPEIARQMVLNGHQTVREFDVNLMVDKIADLYVKSLKWKNENHYPFSPASPKQPSLIE